MSILARTLFVASALVFGCSSTTTADAPIADSAVTTDEGTVDGSSEAAIEDTAIDSALVTARPYGTKIPAAYDKSKPTPLVILLHGYGASGAIQESYFKLGVVADAKTFLLALPDGTLDSSGKRFWNASDACCNFAGAKIDDVAYVNAIIDDMEKKYNVDPKRVYLVGHSNGGFMSHRAACELSPRIAAIVSLAGALSKDPAKCAPTSPVSVLEVHGNADTTILYDGGSVATGVPAYPSAKETIGQWAALEGCSATLSPTTIKLDLDSTLVGDETHVDRHEGCPKSAVELWTIEGGQHVPALTALWATSIYEFLESHPKP